MTTEQLRIIIIGVITVCPALKGVHFWDKPGAVRLVLEFKWWYLGRWGARRRLEKFLREELTVGVDAEVVLG
jgi:hypothetical protein